jgi:bifunctional non-homologous end joining protein LigD
MCAATRRAAALTPESLEPMFASIGTSLPRGDGWTFEPKYDGIRVLVFLTARSVRLVTRNRKDKTRQFPEVATALRAFAAKIRRPVILDGEVVAMVRGAPARFQQLQARMHVKADADIARHAAATPAALVAFDLLRDGGDALLDDPWTERRARLEALLRRRESDGIRLGDSAAGDGEALVQRARDDGWEGVIAKRVESRYEPGARSRDWLKLKVEFRQEFVVGGYTEPRNSREHLGALLLGYFDGGSLTYVGHTGGGFTRNGLAAMKRRLQPLERKTPPFAEPPRTNEPAHWVRPEIVVEVKFNEWTADGRLRQPIFLGVRDDKRARDVQREQESVQRAARGIRRRDSTRL